MNGEEPNEARAYLKAVDDLLQSRFGINANDVGQDSVEGLRRDGWTPDECVAWMEDKYNLERIDIGPYGENHAR